MPAVTACFNRDLISDGSVSSARLALFRLCGADGMVRDNKWLLKLFQGKLVIWLNY